MTIEGYPLFWPDGWPRTPDAERRDGRHQFRRHGDRASAFWTFTEARNALLTEVDRLTGGNPAVLSTNFRQDRNGRPVESSRRPLDQGIALYFDLDGLPVVMARDHYTRAEENMRSLTLAIEAMRALERHGGSTMMRRAFTGFAALAPPRGWRETLGLQNQSDVRRVDIEIAFRERAKRCHPDVGGTPGAMAELNAARDQAIKEIDG